MTRTAHIAILLLVAAYGVRAQSAARYFDDESFNSINTFDHLPIQFTWNIKGKQQVILNEGINELDEGNTDRALLHFDEFIQTDSSFWPALYYRGVTRKKKRLFQDAEKDLLRATKLQPMAFEPYFEVGEIYQVMRQYARAKKAFDKAADLAPDHAEPLYALGGIALSRYEPWKAKRLWEKSLEVNPKFAPAYVSLGILRYKDNKRAYDDNLAWFNNAIKADSTYKPAFFWRAMIYTYNMKLEEAYQDFSRLIVLLGENSLALQMRGYLLIDLGRFDDAFNDFRRAFSSTQLDEDNYMNGRTKVSKQIDLQKCNAYMVRKGYGLNDETFSLMKRAFCLMVVDENKAALAKLKEVDILERNPICSLLKAIAFEHLEMYDSAISNYKKAIQQDNDIYTAHWKLSIYKFEDKDIKGTYQEMKEMQRLEPDAPSTQRLVGFIKTELKDYYGCIIDLSKVIQQDSSDLQVFRTRAFCFSKVKDYKNSNSDYQAVINVNPHDFNSYVAIARNQFEQKDTLAALMTFKKVWKVFPTDRDIPLTVADLMVRTGNYDSAALIVDGLLRSIPKSNTSRYKSDLLFVYAKALTRKGYYDAAITKLDEAIEIIPDGEMLFMRYRLATKVGNTKLAKKDLNELRKMNFGPAKPFFDTLEN